MLIWWHKSYRCRIRHGGRPVTGLKQYLPLITADMHLTISQTYQIIWSQWHFLKQELRGERWQWSTAFAQVQSEVRELSTDGTQNPGLALCTKDVRHVRKLLFVENCCNECLISAHYMDISSMEELYKSVKYVTFGKFPTNISPPLFFFFPDLHNKQTFWDTLYHAR